MNRVPVLETRVLHNFVDERQFVRVTLPSRFRVRPGEGHSWQSLTEISLGGFSFQAEKGPSKIKVGFVGNAVFEFKVGVAVVKIELPIKIIKNKASRMSGEFHDLTGEKREVIRYLIGAYLFGEPCLYWPFMETSE